MISHNYILRNIIQDIFTDSDIYVDYKVHQIKLTENIFKTISFLLCPLIMQS